jgi:WD40 repeat protein
MRRFALVMLSSVLLGLLVACGVRPPGPAPVAEDRHAEPEKAEVEDGTKTVSPVFSLDSGIKRRMGKDEFSGGITSLSVSPDGRYVVALGSGDDKNLEVWDLPARKRLCLLDNKGYAVLPVLIAPDGKSFACARNPGENPSSCRLFALPSGAELRNLQFLREHDFYLPWRLAFSPKGDLLIGACGDPTNRHTGALVGFDPNTGMERFCWMTGHEGRPTALSAFFDEGRKIATAGEKGDVKIWDVPGGKARTLTPFLQSKAVDLAVSPDGKKLVAVPWTGQFHLYDLVSGQAKALNLEGGWVRALFLPDSATIVCGYGNKDSDLLVFNVNSGKRTHRLRGHVKRAYGLALTADGSTLVSGSEDGAINVWDLSKLP